MKIFRVVISGLILWSGIEDRSITYIVSGSLFLLFSLLTGNACCAFRTNIPSEEKDLSQAIMDYEEVGVAK